MSAINLVHRFGWNGCEVGHEDIGYDMVVELAWHMVEVGNNSVFDCESVEYSYRGLCVHRRKKWMSKLRKMSLA